MTSKEKLLGFESLYLSSDQLPTKESHNEAYHTPDKCYLLWVENDPVAGFGELVLPTAFLDVIFPGCRALLTSNQVTFDLMDKARTSVRLTPVQKIHIIYTETYLKSLPGLLPATTETTSTL